MTNFNLAVVAAYAGYMLLLLWLRHHEKIELRVYESK
jgi:hypothetical protein